MTAGWPVPATPAGRVTLAFDGGDAAIHTNLSAVARVGDTLFVAADEKAQLNRFDHDGGDRWVERESGPLAALLPVADPDAEPDLEGMAADGGWLWLVGSHARTRRKVEKEKDDTIDLDRLAVPKRVGGRCLLARLPLVEGKGAWSVVAADGARRAGMLAQDADGNALYRALCDHPLIAPFTAIPAKEGGLDIEGIAVAGDRIALGLRGPVVGTHAVMVEFTIAADAAGALSIATPPVVRLIAVAGLGIRDLERDGDDLLILAGPTADLDGPCTLYRWRGWAGDPARAAHRVRLHRPDHVVDLPFGRGDDHPEALSRWPGAQLLVICDSPAAGRVDGATVTADLFDLPPAG